MAPLRVPAHKTKASCGWSLTAAVVAARLRDALPAVSSGPRAGTGPRGMWHHTTPFLSEPEHPVFLTEAPDTQPRPHDADHVRNVQRARHKRGDSSCV